MLRITYFDFSANVGLENHFSNATHRIIWEILNAHFPNWKGFRQRKQDYKLWFTLVTKKDVMHLEVKGPDISRRHKEYHYAIYLPENIADVNAYIDLVFQGFAQVLTEFDVSQDEIETIKQECKIRLNLE